ncbi:hypothetical protein BH23GEM8_BH23GEM8_04610 [soil metagenome]
MTVIGVLRADTWSGIAEYVDGLAAIRQTRMDYG